MELNDFLDAADHGDLDRLEAGLLAGLDVNAVDGGGWTALLTAARAGRFDAVRLLLDRGADPKAERPGGFGPLHLVIVAAKPGLGPQHLRIVDALLQAGADPNQQTSRAGQSPVRNAAALQGREEFPTTRDDRHVLDAVFGLWRRDERRADLFEGFRGLRIHRDPKLRSASVHFHVKFLIPDDGAVLRAWTQFPALYEGVTSPWYPEDTDLRAC